MCYKDRTGPDTDIYLRFCSSACPASQFSRLLSSNEAGDMTLKRKFTKLSKGISYVCIVYILLKNIYHHLFTWYSPRAGAHRGINRIYILIKSIKRFFFTSSVPDLTLPGVPGTGVIFFLKRFSYTISRSKILTLFSGKGKLNTPQDVGKFYNPSFRSNGVGNSDIPCLGLVE